MGVSWGLLQRPKSVVCYIVSLPNLPWPYLGCLTRPPGRAEEPWVACQNAVQPPDPGLNLPLNC